MLLSFIVKFCATYICHVKKNKQKKAEFGPFFKKAINKGRLFHIDDIYNLYAENELIGPATSFTIILFTFNTM